MAKGLSTQQKRILEILEDYPRGIGFKEATTLIKEKYYPTLYPSKTIVFDGMIIKTTKASYSKEKARVRVILSRSIKRLEERGLIICNDSEYYPDSYSHHTLPDFELKLTKFIGYKKNQNFSVANEIDE